MIVIVTLNHFGSNESLIERTYAAWIVGKLLDDANFRSEFKYLAVRCKDKILGIYCILGIAEFPTEENFKRVQFYLKPVSDICFKKLKLILESIIENDRSYIINGGRKYILRDYLTENGYNLPDDCDCGVKLIPVLNPDDKIFKEQTEPKSTKR
jgi:hypothetical protein